MTQEATPERDPIEEYWASYGKQSPFRTDTPDSPWVDGRYAFAAIAWGLIFMLLISAGAG